ncbi:MAG TPA: efflux transporter outer membrane subunit [Burkholderiaceae bacterium]|jgi:NodT family efflux transporter outer membrane factor (OMF) lipoprotein
MTRPLTLILSALSLALLAAGCTTVGPDYKGAPAVAPGAMQAPHFARETTGTDAKAPVSAAWWRSFGDTTLDTLVDQALHDSPTLAAAQARLRQARATLSQRDAERLPTASASGLGLYLRQAPTTDHATTTQLYSLGFDATWEADLFGGTRRSIEQASAQAEAVQADLADAQVSLAAEVVQSYVALRAQQQSQALWQEKAKLDEQAMVLARQRRAAGVASADELEQRETQREATQASLADTAGQISASLDQLALLTGQAPGALDALLLTHARALPSLPDEVPIGDPAELLQRRPDIRAAERRLAASNAQIGQETAKYFPKLSLIGGLGLAGAHPSNLFSASGLSLLGVPYLSWNVFDFGRTAAGVRQAEAGRDESIAKYQAAVLGALQDANSALSRYGQHRQMLMHQEAQQASAQRSLALTQQRRQAGVASDLDLFDAGRTRSDAQLKTLDGEAALLKDFVALQKSLGLGWR